MAVTVTDTRTVFNEADNATGWTGGGTAGSSVFVEAPNAIIGTLNIATGQFYFTGTSQNLSNTMVYVWSNNYALQGSWLDANPPNALHLGDGTNRVSFRMAGGDRKVFAHLEGQFVDWDCLVLDGSQASAMNTNSLTVARAGSFASLNLSAITQVGSDFTTLSKGLGGGTNVAVDIIRIGNGGIVITGGTTGDRGKFIQIVNEDKSTANLKAHGIIREYSTGLYGVQGPLTFGAATGTSWFDDAGTIAFENRNISDDKYFIAVVGGTGETHFILRNASITTAGPRVRCDFNSNNIDELNISDNTFANLGNPITFGTDTAAQSHTVRRNVFNTCGQINPGVTIFENNSILNSTDSVTGALILNAGDATNLSGISFQSGGTGHAIYITATGTYTFTEFTYEGYGADGTTDAVIYNNSGGAVTVNVSGGGTPTVRNGTGATTTINNTVTVTLTGMKDNTEVRVYTAGTTTEVAGIEDAVTGTADNRSFSFSSSGGANLDIRVFNILFEPADILGYIVPALDSSLPIQQRADRTYDNPPGTP